MKNFLILRPIRGKKPKKYPTNLVFLDTEDDSEGDIQLFTIFDGGKYITCQGFFNCREKALKWLMENRTKEKTIFAHNLLYDLINLFGADFLLANFDLYFTKSRFIFAKFGKLTFQDTTLLFPGSLKKLGDFVGLKKLETDNFLDKDYNKRDVDILKKAITEYMAILKEKNFDFGLTNGAIALKIFRRHYLKKTIYFDKRHIDFCKQAYYGGRTENLIKGKITGKIFVYDVNSLYPYVMRSNYFPNPTRYKESTELNEYGIYDITVQVKEFFPLLPVRYDGRLIFPNGTFRTVCTGAEIIASKCKIIKIHYGLVFDRGEKYFKNFVDDLYDLRVKNKNNFMGLVIKNILNSLYGKFGQGNETVKYDRDLQDFVDEKGEYKDNSIFPWAVFVTAYARIYMYKLINNMINSGATVFYTDTDSIHTNLQLNNTDLSLGGLKCEGEFSSAEYQAAKQYYLLDSKTKKEYIRVKGVPEKYAKLFFMEKFVEYDKPNKLKESLKRGLKPNKWEKREKRFLDSSDKRIFSGVKSWPLIIGEKENG
jgi:hypothetical protein